MELQRVQSVSEVKVISREARAVDNVLSDLKGYGQSIFFSSAEKQKLIKNLENIRRGRETRELTPIHEIILIQKLLEKELGLTPSQNSDPKLLIALENFNNKHQFALDFVDSFYVPYVFLMMKRSMGMQDLLRKEEEAFSNAGINPKEFRTKYNTEKFLGQAKVDLLRLRTEIPRGKSDALKKDVFLVVRLGLLNIDIDKYRKKIEAESLVSSPTFAFLNKTSLNSAEGVQLSVPQSQDPVEPPPDEEKSEHKKNSNESSKIPDGLVPNSSTLESLRISDVYFPNSPTFWNSDLKKMPLPTPEGRIVEEIPLDIKTGASLGEAKKNFSLGNDCANGTNGMEKNLMEACRYYDLAAEQGYAPAQYELGIYYEKGIGIERNESEAFNFYSLAAKQNHAPAQFKQGLCYRKGIGVEKNFKASWRCILLAAEQGYAPAQYELGDWHNKQSSRGDQEKAVNYFILAAKQGLSEAVKVLEHQKFDRRTSSLELINTLGDCYREGLGVSSRNLEMALGYYGYAKERGCIEGTEKFNQISKRYDAIHSPSKAQCAGDLVSEANRGNIEAQLKVGKLFLNGEEGLKQDPKQALRWFLEAADNNSEAAYQAGYCFLKGLGCEKNLGEANNYLMKAVVKGHSQALELIRNFAALSLEDEAIVSTQTSTAPPMM